MKWSISMDVELEIRKLKEKINELDGENKKYRRLIEDTLNNVDMDNLSTSVKKEIKAAGKNAEIAITAAGESSAEVSIIAQSIGSEDPDTGKFVVNAASIVAKVNELDGSTVVIDADKIELNGITNVAETLTLGSGTGGEIIFDSHASVSADSAANMDISANTLHLQATSGLTMSNLISGDTINGDFIPLEQNIVGSYDEKVIYIRPNFPLNNEFLFYIKDVYDNTVSIVKVTGQTIYPA